MLFSIAKLILTLIGGIAALSLNLEIIKKNVAKIKKRMEQPKKFSFSVVQMQVQEDRYKRN